MRQSVWEVCVVKEGAKLEEVEGEELEGEVGSLDVRRCLERVWEVVGV